MQKKNEEILTFPVTNDINILNESKNIVLAIGDNFERSSFFISLK